MRLSHLARPKPLIAAGAVALSMIVLTGLSASASTPTTDQRLTHDNPGSGGYVSNYNLNHPGAGVAKDATLTECSRSRGRQNEPSVAVNPRNPDVIVGSSNDYCGVYNDGVDADGAPIPSGPIWLGYYRSENRGGSFQCSLVPGYPGDNTPYASRAQIRTASSGDPVLAWDGQGRLFAGSESSDDRDGSRKSFGDVWVATYRNPGGVAAPTVNDGKEFSRSVIVAKGTSAPNFLGKFNDKTAIAADRTNNPATRGNVYFAYSRFASNGGSNIYFSRSTDHGATFSHPVLLTTNDQDVQFPDIDINADGTVTVTWHAFRTSGQFLDALRYAVSVDGGATFSAARTAAQFENYGAIDTLVTGGGARDCGDLTSACVSGYHFFRHDSGPRSAADQTNPADHTVHIVIEAVVPGSEVATDEPTYGVTQRGVGGQGAIYAMTLNPRTGAKTGLIRVAPEATGNQLFPDVAVDQGVVHVLWWDSKNDTCYSPKRPIGNCADKSVVPSLDTYGATLGAAQAAVGLSRISDVRTQPNYEQFGGRTVPFAGDYLWVDSAAGTTYSVWTEARHGGRRRPAYAGNLGGRGAPVPHPAAGRLVHRRHLPARRRDRPEHLRRPVAVAPVGGPARPRAGPRQYLHLRTGDRGIIPACTSPYARSFPGRADLPGHSHSSVRQPLRSRGLF